MLPQSARPHRHGSFGLVARRSGRAVPATTQHRVWGAHLATDWPCEPSRHPARACGVGAGIRILPARPRRHDLAGLDDTRGSGDAPDRAPPGRGGDRSRGLGARARTGYSIRRPRCSAALDDRATSTRTDPLVREAWTRNPHWRVSTNRPGPGSARGRCIEQKVTGQEAFLGWRRLVRRFGLPAPGPGTERGMLTLPAAEALAHVPSWEWLRCHIDGARSTTIVRAARVAASLERTVGLPGDEVERRLTSLPGVGVWTAAEVRQRAHGDADAVSFGDYHIARHVGWAVTGEEFDDADLAGAARAVPPAPLPGPARRHDAACPGRPRRGPGWRRADISRDDGRHAPRGSADAWQSRSTFSA